MPVYEYKCLCGWKGEEYRKVSERNDPLTCPSCHQEASRAIETPFMKVFEPITLEHVEENPVTFTSEEQLRSYCKQKGFQSGALL